MTAGVLLSLLAVGFFATSAVLQHQRSIVKPAEANLRPELFIALLRDTWWWLSIALVGVGYLFQTAALRFASLDVVQPIQVLGLVLAVPASTVFVERRRIGFKELLAAASTAAAIAIFLLVAHPTKGEDTAPAASWAAVLSVSAAIVLTLATGSLFVKGFPRAFFQATAGGVTNGVQVVGLKGLSHTINMGSRFHWNLSSWLEHVLTSPFLWLALVCAVVLWVTIQSAYNVGPIHWSLPALNVANPLTAMVLGAYLFDERIALGPGAVGMYVLCAASALAGILVLSRASSFGAGRTRGPVTQAVEIGS